MKHSMWVTGLAAALAACSTEAPVAPTLDATMGRGNPRGAQTITVMQQNMYVGADVDAIIAAILSGDPEKIQDALDLAIVTLQNTDVVLRAGAIADQIKKTRPHVVGLQEVSTITVGPLVIPFLDILEGALAARGLDYGVCDHLNFTVSPVEGVSLADADVLLYDRTRVTKLECGGGTFSYQIGVLGIARGWGYLTGEVNGDTQTFVVTHLESGPPSPDFDALRAAQASELVGAFAAVAPVTILGDFNDSTTSPMYAVMKGAGYEDLWATRHPGAPGYTCCELPDLSNRTPVLNQRIDFIFTRDLPSLQGQMMVIGDNPSALIPGPSYPIWPSDHAGLIGTFLMPAAGTK